MTDKELTTVFEGRMKEFQDLLKHNACFSAATRLGQIALATRELPGSRRAEWERVLDRSKGLVDLDRVAIGVDEAVARVARIAQRQGQYEFEELCLVLSIRLDVRCALAFLELARRTLQSNSMALIDAAVSTMADDDKARVALNRAAAHIARNYGLPINVSDVLPKTWAH